MPEIPAKPGAWDELAFTALRLCINPESLEATASLEGELQGHRIAGVVQAIGIVNALLTQEDFDLVSKSDPKGSPTIYQNRTSIRDAFIAGQILMRAMRLAENSRAASFGQAKKIVMHELSSGPHPLKDSAIRTLWARFKGVSHITGAMFFAAKELAPMGLFVDELRKGAPVNYSPPANKFSDTERQEILSGMDSLTKPLTVIGALMVRRYFSYAEALRARGERHFAPGQQVRSLSFLDPQVMWTVPKTFKLSRVKLNLGSSLAVWEKQVLRKNK